LRTARLLLCLAATLAASCSHTPWPDEPVIPVELARTLNIESGDMFFAALTNRRRATARAEPVIAPGHQTEINVFAEDLQTGKATVGGTERAVAKWARRAYRVDVRVFLLDCAAGSAMPLPEVLVDMPVVVMSYAAAHFRPRSLPTTQCAIVAAVAIGAERVEGAIP
jgi:hypothetical protein